MELSIRKSGAKINGKLQPFWIIAYGCLGNSPCIPEDMNVKPDQYIKLCQEKFEIYVGNAQGYSKYPCFYKKADAQAAINEVIIPRMVAHRLRTAK